MFFDGEYRTIGTVDVAPLKALIDTFSGQDWDAMASRQRVYAAHVRTNTIPLIFDEDMRHDNPTRWPMMDRFEDALLPAMTRIRDYYASIAGDGHGSGKHSYFARAIVVKLPAGAEIKSHTDGTPSLLRSHRVHLPIATNDKVLFAIAGHIRNMPEGELCEINNRKSHAVRNGSAHDRVHAILDYVVPGEVIEDPQGRIVA